MVLIEYLLTEDSQKKLKELKENPQINYIRDYSDPPEYIQFFYKKNLITIININADPNKEIEIHKSGLWQILHPKICSALKSFKPESLN